LAYSIYDACVPPLAHMLGSYSGFLTKAENFLKEKGINPDTYLDARLYEDMLPLKNQVFIATDMAKGGGARLAQVEVPKYEDTEKSFEELRARLRKTIAFLRGLDAKAFVGAEDREIHLKFPTREMKFSGADYLNNFVMPNVYFHITTGYGILRSKGVPLGKPDFLAGQ
jgi:uncharacterized protein